MPAAKKKKQKLTLPIILSKAGAKMTKEKQLNNKWLNERCKNIEVIILHHSPSAIARLYPDPSSSMTLSGKLRRKNRIFSMTRVLTAGYSLTNC